MSFIRKHSAFFAAITLLAYFYIAQTSIQTKHTHFYPNGVVVTHSHPMYSEGEDPGEPATHHHHSKSEICFFNNFQFHYFNISEPVNIQVLIPETHHEYFVGEDLFLTNPDYFKTSPRAPPLG